MAFMKPYVHYGQWVEITHDCGSTSWVEADYANATLPDLLKEKEELNEDNVLDFIRDTMPLRRRPLHRRVRVWERKTARLAKELWEYLSSGLKENVEAGKVEAVLWRCGWGARMSAPGYMDCTDWCVYDTEKEAWQELCDQNDLCEECGEELDEDGVCADCDKPSYEDSMADSIKEE